MSGIIGSKLNHRGSGRIAKLGTDGQVLTSSGPGVQANYEDAAGGGVSWQSVVTASTFTAVAGNGYPVNTTSNACTVTLPASASVGDQIIFTDYARNFATNALTINQNSLNYQGNSSPNPVYDTAGESIHIVYQDTTKGWIPTYDGAVALETPQPVDHEYLVVGGGGGGGYNIGGGGGAGGYLTNYGGTAIALNPGVTFTITVGAGGAGKADSGGTGVAGVDSSISGTGITTITSDGGGGGGSINVDGLDGGSGGAGGGGTYAVGGDGTAGPPRQGYGGGDANAGSYYPAGGGGGASEAGDDGVGATGGGDGGDGTANSITGSSVTYAGGGGGGTENGGTKGDGGAGGGGAGGQSGVDGTVGTNYLGGGAGGGKSGGAGVVGGIGIVILRVATADKGTPSGEASSATDGSDTVIKWHGDGSYVTA